MHILKPLLACISLLLLVTGWSPGRAEESVRECIHFASSGNEYTLPADQQWHTIGTLKFNLADDSHFIATAGLFFGDGNPTNAQLTYRFTLNGQRKGFNFIHRTAKGFFDSLDLRTIMTNVEAADGDHTLTVDALNQTGSPVHFRGFWISPHMVDAGETTAKDFFNTGSPVTVGDVWTTVAEVSLNPTTSKSVYLGGFVEAGGGTAGARLDYRFYLSSHNMELRSLSDTVPGFPDGAHMAYILELPPSGTNTVQLQVRATNGDLTDISRAFLFAEVMPQYTVFSGGNWGNVIPSDDNWYVVGDSPSETIKSISRGKMGTWGTGFGHTTMHGPLLASTQWCFEILQNGSPLSFDVGCHQLHADGKTQLKTTMSDWGGRVGLNGTDLYAIRLKARVRCISTSDDLQLAQTDFQVAVLPSSDELISEDCPAGTTWADCCTSEEYGPNCTYECEGNPSLLTPIETSHNPCT